MLPKKTQEQLASNIYLPTEERLNALTHFAGFILALLGLLLLLLKSQTTKEAVVSTVYGLSLTSMFLSSTIYHSVQNKKYKLLFRKVDHIAIYLLIAGTYTPFLALAVASTTAYIGLFVVWLIGFLGIIFKIYFGHTYPKLSVSTYAAMGWLAILLIYPIYQSLSFSGFILLLIGGLCYSAGIPLYLLKSRHYSHALWHVFVFAGALCHFIAIYLHVL